MDTIYEKLIYKIRKLPTIKMVYSEYRMFATVPLKDINHYVTKQIYDKYPEIKKHFANQFPNYKMRCSVLVTDIFENSSYNGKLHNVPISDTPYIIENIPIVFYDSTHNYKFENSLNNFILEFLKQYNSFSDENIDHFIQKKIKKAHELMYKFNKYINNDVKNAAD